MTIAGRLVEQARHHASPEVLGLALFVASVLFATTMGLAAKLAGGPPHNVPVFEIVLARSVVLLLLTLPQLMRQRINPLRSDRKLLLLARGLLGLGAVSSLYGAVQYLPIADAAVLQFLAPVFVAAGAPLLLGELPPRGVWAALPTCLLGVVLVAQPTFLFGGQEPVSGLGMAIGVLQAAFSASAKMAIRSLGSTEPVQTIVAAMAAVSTAGSLLLCALLPNHWVVPRRPTTWLLLGAAGLLGFGNQYLSTAALKMTNAASAVAMSYSGVLYGIFLDLVVFHDRPGALSLAGAAVVCAGSYLVVRSEQQRRGAGGGGGGGGDGKLQVASRRGETGSDEERVELIEAGGRRTRNGEYGGGRGGGGDSFVFKPGLAAADSPRALGSPHARSAPVLLQVHAHGGSDHSGA